MAAPSRGAARRAPALAAPLALELAAPLPACAPTHPPGAVLGPTVRVCEGDRPCEFRPTASASFRPEEAARQGERQRDPDAYRGENLGELRAAGQAGDPGASYRLGLVHQQGLAGAPRDAVEAARWFAVAAENGVPEAQYNLGLMHYRGEGVPRQLREALRWMRQAAANGHLPAQRAVGQLHLTGLDTMGQDLSEARTWLAAAANRGDRESERLLRELDRAQAAERDHARRLQVLSSYTAAHWASAAYAAHWWRPSGCHGYCGWY